MAEPDATATEPATKVCTTCHDPKPIEEFPFTTNGHGGRVRRSTCQGCRIAYGRRYRKNKREGTAAPPPESVVGDFFKQQWPNVELFDREAPADEGGDVTDAEVAEPMIMFGNAIERECMYALLQHGSIERAAEAMSLTPERLRAHLSELQRRAARRGYAPGSEMTMVQPPGFHVKGVSTQIDANGNVMSQWIKTRTDEEHKLAMLADALRGIADAWPNIAAPVEQPADLDDDLLCVYGIGDPHFGMHAWGEETGRDFDLKIAERNLCSAVDNLVAVAPRARHALIVEVGDFFHADNSSNQTLRSHHALDVDTRWAKVIQVGIRAMRRCIDRALEKHELVTVICEQGNHDDHSAIMLAMCLAQFYEREPRVTIDTSPAKFHWFRFGKVMLGVTHGDSIKPKDMPSVMATDQAKNWGETQYRHFYTGHVHHESLKEFPGCTVETLRTLAATDAWHASKGYRSGRDMKCDVWHRERGLRTRHVIGIAEIEGR